ncbi:MAG: hypothetical protein HKO76_02810, partial [Acidimicrobiia bacterium]|nr:hypothetical protein [Acidimicrobiia bacterium]
AKLYDSPWGLEATLRLNDYNQQGVVLWAAGSKPYTTRTLAMLPDLKTFKFFDSGLGEDVVRVFSATGWDASLIRTREVAAPPVMEGDILVIHQGQPGASLLAPGYYEIGEVYGSSEMRLLIASPKEDPTTFDIGPTPPSEPKLDPDLFEYGEPLTGSIVRRLTFAAVRKGTDLTTTNATSRGSVVSAGLLNDGVSPGHHLIIEGGANEGEYLIEGVNSTPPYITDSDMALLNLDGSAATVADASGQTFWVMDPRHRLAEIDGAQSIYTGSRIELEILDPVTGVEFQMFTPGMVGTVIEVSGSDQAVNDGGFLITEYISPGKVALDSVSVTSDTAAQSTIHF